jgi:para-aminobenzoate synthetase component 1
MSQNINAILADVPDILGVHTVDDPEVDSLIDLGARLAAREGTMLLLSGGKSDSARHHILGFDPWLTLRGRGPEISLAVDGQTHALRMDPLEALRAVLQRFAEPMGATAVWPLASGLMGYLGYDLKDAIEALPRTSIDRWRMPHLCLFAPRVVFVQDLASGRIRYHEAQRPEALQPERLQIADLMALALPDESFTADAGGMASNFAREDYLRAVTRIRDYIAAGDVYQVNLSQRFETRFDGSAFGFFRALFQKNPAPFFAYLNAGDHQIVSTSPERFIQAIGERVETRPIKGTRPRDPDPEIDRALAEDLRYSPKDDAELAMIVDLLRNDLGRVCRGGSVRVVNHKALEAYDNVYHLVSTVTGRLAEGKDAVDLIRAVFPGGSITGCPKIRAMEIIDELEPDRRHIYTGAMGYIGFQNGMDLSIAIRTAVIHCNRLTFAVGGGIVYDSDPETEYEETLHKGRTLLSVCTTCQSPPPPLPMVWFDGRIGPQDKACLAIDDLGVRYGFGFFETMRADDGAVSLLRHHRRRFEATWQALFATAAPDLTWEHIIRQVLEANELTRQCAVVRLTATRGREGAVPEPHVFLSAAPYRHRLQTLGAEGLRLRVYPESRRSPLADYKSLNYLYYFQAGAWARSQGADEALVLNPDGSVSETNTANILALRGKTLQRPCSAHVLPGIMEACALEYLKNQGYRIAHKPLFPVDLYSADQVFVTNALMGAVPVVALDETAVAAPSALCRRINAAIFERTHPPA